MSGIQPPPNKNPVIGKNGLVDNHWLDFFIALNTGTAPVNGPYLIVEANSALTGAIDLGLLATGYLRQTTVAGVATPASVTFIPQSDLRWSTVAKTFADTGFVATAGLLVIVDATGGATTIKLPATPSDGQSVIIKKTDASANAVTVDGNGSNIDGAGTQALANRWSSQIYTFSVAGSSWFIDGKVV